ncbi:MAG: hypothetical protein WC786_00770, partial [Patescibacteria group bacterium]
LEDKMQKPIIGIMGPGRSATQEEQADAHALGTIVAELGCILLTGGVAHGVMDAACKGARERGGMTIGILPHKLPSETHPISEYVDIPIITTFGEGRNLINAFSCKVILVVGMCPGTASEVCFAIKAGVPVILLRPTDEALNFFQKILKGTVRTARTPRDARAALQIELS